MPQSQEILQAILDATPDPVFVKDLAGRFVLVNPACARIAEMQPGDFIGKRDADIFGGSSAHLEAADRRVMETGITEVLEEFVSFGGRTRVYLSTKSAWRNADGRIIGLIGIAREITEAKRTELALHDSQERLHLALKAGKLGIWDYNGETGRLEWTENHYRLFGLDPARERATTGLFEQRIHPDDRERVNRIVSEAHVTGHDFSLDYRVVWPDGSVHWLESRGEVTSKPGEPPRTVGAVSDITDRKQVEEKLREAAKLESLGILAGGLAHDFNNLLACILGNASIIEEESAPGSPVHEMATDIMTASERAAHLTKQMLAYSGRGQFVVEPVDLSVQVQQVTELLNPSVLANTRLVLELDPALPNVDADQRQIHQAIMNLVFNAAEAIGTSGGQVTIRTGLRLVAPEEQSNPRFGRELHSIYYAFVEVSDTGHGISEELRDRIFDPFFTTKSPGRGLGLAAVQGIVRSHNGLIRLESGPDGGTTFTLLFPPSSSRMPRSGR